MSMSANEENTKIVNIQSTKQSTKAANDLVNEHNLDIKTNHNFFCDKDPKNIVINGPINDKKITIKKNNQSNNQIVITSLDKKNYKQFKNITFEFLNRYKLLIIFFSIFIHGLFLLYVSFSKHEIF